MLPFLSYQMFVVHPQTLWKMNYQKVDPTQVVCGMSTLWIVLFQVTADCPHQQLSGEFPACNSPLIHTYIISSFSRSSSPSALSISLFLCPHFCEAAPITKRRTSDLANKRSIAVTSISAAITFLCGGFCLLKLDRSLVGWLAGWLAG